jgi:hypothetical protein
VKRFSFNKMHFSFKLRSKKLLLPKLNKITRRILSFLFKENLTRVV